MNIRMCKNVIYRLVYGRTCMSAPMRNVRFIVLPDDGSIYLIACWVNTKHLACLLYISHEMQTDG
jgi:hypothetical protein